MTALQVPTLIAERLAKARSLMHVHGLDYIMVGPSADLYYLTGARSHTSERMTLFILPQEGPASIVVPGFEAALLPPLGDEIQVKTWGERDNPARLAALQIASAANHSPGGFSCTIGASDQLWSVFLLRLQAELPRATFTSASTVLSALRQIKSADEVENLRTSGEAADAVFAEIIERPFIGRTEAEIGQEIVDGLKARGLEVPGHAIVASGPNSASPHHHTGSRRIEAGDAIVLDFGGTVGGYYSDITRTVFAGRAPEPGSEETHVYGLVAAAQQSAFEAARPGMTCEDLDSVARSLLEAAGYGEFFNHRLGHGIGLDGHELPYLVSGNTAQLQPGMAFSLEPGLYLPGKFGIRIEDIVVLEQAGARRMNNADRGIVVVQ
ncbi:MAG TPA: Xaa-Pro peptidase family protein [Chloroflexia bacterium]|nr:Xaa-Pro peptidase family protein [Chloroflexia bacterium]